MGICVLCFHQTAHPIILPILIVSALTVSSQTDSSQPVTSSSSSSKKSKGRTYKPVDPEKHLNNLKPVEPEEICFQSCFLLSCFFSSLLSRNSQSHSLQIQQQLSIKLVIDELKVGDESKDKGTFIVMFSSLMLLQLSFAQKFVVTFITFSATTEHKASH